MEQVNQFIIWPIAFLVVIVPLWSFLNTFREQIEKEKSILKDKEEKDKKIWLEIIGTKYEIMILWAATITFVAIIISFFIFSLK